MITHNIVFAHTGENAPTPRDPHCLLEDFSGNLHAAATRCMSWDNNMQVEIDLYEVREVALPEWLSPREWLEDHIKWGYAWNRGVDPNWSESWQRGLLKLSPGLQVACCKLLKTKNFRSRFRQSLRDQLVQWLENPAPKYARPFSDRQEWSLVQFRDVTEAKRADESCYHRSLSSCGVLP